MKERQKETNLRAQLKSKVLCLKWLRQQKKSKNYSRINRLQSKLSASNSLNCSKLRTNMNSCSRISISSLICSSCKSYWLKVVTWVQRRLCWVQLRQRTRGWNALQTFFTTSCWTIRRSCFHPSTKSSIWLQVRRMSKSVTILRRNKTRWDCTSSPISWPVLQSKHSLNADVL